MSRKKLRLGLGHMEKSNDRDLHEGRGARFDEQFSAFAVWLRWMNIADPALETGGGTPSRKVRFK